MDTKPFMTGQLFRETGAPGPYFEVLKTATGYHIRLTSHLNPERSLVDEGDVAGTGELVQWLDDRVDY